MSYEGDSELNFLSANNSRVYCEYYCHSFCSGRFLVMIVEDYLELSGHRISIFCDPWWILLGIEMTDNKW